MIFTNEKALTHITLKQYRDLAVSYFGEGISTLTSMQNWVNLNCADFVNIINDNNTEAGYCLVYLNTHGELDLINGNVTGATFESKHLSSGEGKPDVVYIGSLFAQNKLASKAMFKQLWQHLGKWQQQGISYVYAKTVSPDGVRVIAGRRLQGKPIHAGSDIYRINLQACKLN